MRATLAQYFRMSLEERRLVTYLDASIVDDEDFHRSLPSNAERISNLEEEERREIYGKGSQ